MDLKWLEDKPQAAFNLAKVVEVVAGKGVKIKLDSEASARETYYNSLVIPVVNDRVFYLETSGTLLIIGTLKY